MVAHRQAHDPHLASPQTRRRLRLRCCGRAAVIDGAEPAAQRRPAEGARPLGHGELCLTTTVSAPAPHSCPRALYARRCPYAQRCPAPVAAAVARARRSRAERQKPGGRCRPGASRSTNCTAPGDTTENRRWRKPIWLCRLGDWRSGGLRLSWSAPTLTRPPHMRNRASPLPPCLTAELLVGKGAESARCARFGR